MSGGGGAKAPAVALLGWEEGGSETPCQELSDFGSPTCQMPSCGSEMEPGMAYGAEQSDSETAEGADSLFHNWSDILGSERCWVLRNTIELTGFSW